LKEVESSACETDFTILWNTCSRLGSDLAGVVVFWGSLNMERPAQKGAVEARVLALEGMEDPWVSVEQVKQFKAEM
jgi:dienelactone hydrolase